MDEKKVRVAIEALKITIDIGKQKIEYNKTFEPKNDNEHIEKSIECAKTAIEALEKQLPKKVENWNGVSSMEEIRVGDIVMCVEYPGNPCGIVVKQYRPTACGQQTMIKCNDGRLFHAPTSDFRKIR